MGQTKQNLTNRLTQSSSIYGIETSLIRVRSLENRNLHEQRMAKEVSSFKLQEATLSKDKSSTTDIFIKIMTANSSNG